MLEEPYRRIRALEAEAQLDDPAQSKTIRKLDLPAIDGLKRVIGRGRKAGVFPASIVETVLRSVGVGR